MGNGHQNHKFSSPKNRGGILLYCAGTDGNTCGWKSRRDEKQLIDLEWPYVYFMTIMSPCNHLHTHTQGSRSTSDHKHNNNIIIII